ncbi:MAG TPA: co-chaperone GroES [Candidatus Babeliales bacterium]|nr:co-chaperone GroES [Candidatus Babeliales bacterium]
MFQKFRPLGDRVLVKLVEVEEKTTSGIIIPDAAKEKPQQGIIVAVGQGRTHEGKITPLSVNINDTVYFGKYAGTDAGNNHLIIREDDILGIIEQ